jgi:hypothetical protein
VGMMRYCRLPYTEEVWGTEYVLFFKGGRRLDKHGGCIENNTAFSDVVVIFCEIFTCLTCKFHEFEKKEALIFDKCTYIWLSIKVFK